MAGFLWTIMAELCIVKRVYKDIIGCAQFFPKTLKFRLLSSKIKTMFVFWSLKLQEIKVNIKIKPVKNY